MGTSRATGVPDLEPMSAYVSSEGTQLEGAVSKTPRVLQTLEVLQNHVWCYAQGTS
jgi:hypothetical protein